MIVFNVDEALKKISQADYHCSSCNARWQMEVPGKGQYKDVIKEQIHMWCPQCGTLDKLRDRTDDYA